MIKQEETYILECYECLRGLTHTGTSEEEFEGDAFDDATQLATAVKTYNWSIIAHPSGPNGTVGLCETHTPPSTRAVLSTPLPTTLYSLWCDSCDELLTDPYGERGSYQLTVSDLLYLAHSLEDEDSPWLIDHVDKNEVFALCYTCKHARDKEYNEKEETNV